jgi:hypothetical protein
LRKNHRFLPKQIKRMILAFCFLLSAAPPDTLPYDLNNPSFLIYLVSEELKEISGLSPTDTAGIYLAIADERGEIFLLTVTAAVRFSGKCSSATRVILKVLKWSGNAFMPQKATATYSRSAAGTAPAQR